MLSLLTTIRGLVIGWAISAVLLLAALAMVFTGHPGIGIVLFAIGALGTVTVTLGMLRQRANLRERSPE